MNSATMVSLATVMALGNMLCSGEASATRDPWLWPFAADSIWNTPIGEDAQYRGEGHFKAEGSVGGDIEFHYKVSAQAPLRPLHQPLGWPVVDGKQGRFFRDIRIDDDIVLRTQVSNNCAAFLMPDGRTLEQVEPFIRMQAGGPVLGIPNPFNGGIDLTGPGIIGSHWGSGLSAFGGALRHGELTDDQPIRHALKLDVYCRRYLHYAASSPTPGYRWPATTADGYAGDPANGGYQGTDPRMVQGSLLAIAPRHDAASLGLKTKPARKLLRALQDYGAYVVDDSALDAYYLCPSYEAAGEFREVHGHAMDVHAGATGAAKDWRDDVLKLMHVLSVVDDNRPGNIGGAGRRRAPAATPIGAMDTTPPTPPGSLTAREVMPTSVTLTWSAGRDDVRVAGYRVYAEGRREPLAETFGQCRVVVTGLEPATRHVFTIHSIDTGLNRSVASGPCIVTTLPVAAGTVLEDFDDGEADGWILDRAAVRSRRLELADWGGTTRAYCCGSDLPPAFSLSADIAAVGGGAGNTGRIVFRHHDDANTCRIEFAGGPSAPVILTQVLAGQQAILARASGWSAGRVELTCDAMGGITLTLSSGGASRRLFDAVRTTVPGGGRIGFESRFNAISIDDVRLLPAEK